MRLMADGTTPSESQRRRATRIADRIAELYPEARTALDWKSPWQLLVSTAISAQTTDENVNKAVPGLFARFPDPEDLANADPEEVEQLIFSTGFYRQKTRSIISLAQDLVDVYGGVVPDDMDELVKLKGVGRKTASVVLAEVWDQPEIAVDTHVKRVANRLDLTVHEDPVKIEKDLKAQVPVRLHSRFSMRVILFGRGVCDARKPACGTCPIRRTCHWPGKS